MTDVKLHLDVAVSIQPLDPQIAFEHLVNDGPVGRRLVQVLHELPEPYELLQTPLLVSMAAFEAPSARNARVDEGSAIGLAEVAANYVRGRLRDPTPASSDSYSVDSTKRWLAWLARRMNEEQRSVFLVGRIPLHWLDSAFARRLVLLSCPVVAGLAFALALGGGIQAAARIGVAGPDPASTAAAICLLGLVAGLISEWRRGNRLLVWLGFGIAEALVDDASDVTSYWFIAAVLVYGSLLGFLGEVIAVFLSRQLPLVETFTWSWPRVRRALPRAVSVGLPLALIFDILNWLLIGGSLESALSVGAVLGVVLGVSIGLSFGLVKGVGSGSIPVHVTPYVGLRRSARHGIRAGLVACMVAAGLFFVSGLLLNSQLALIRAVSWGLGAGVFWSLTSGLGAVIQYTCLRLCLWGMRLAPVAYVKWLEYAVSLRVLYRGPGGGYVFLHRIVQESCASAGDAGVDSTEDLSNE